METKSVEKFIYDNLKLIDLEHEQELNQSKSYREKLSLVELQNRGICLIRLCLISMRTGLYGRTVVTFGPKWSSKQLPSNGITSGDVVGISANNDSIVLISGVVLKVESISIDVAFDGDISVLNDNNDNQIYNLIKLTNDVTHRRLKSALNNLKKNSVSHNLIHVLFGETEISVQLTENVNQIEYFNTSLNDSQKESIKFALNQKEIAIIHGPPGTGKTTTLIEFILQCVRNYDLKVLATAPSNVAVDNLLEKLSIAKQDNVVRLGHPARAFSQLQKYSLDAAIERSDEFQIVCDMRSEIEKMTKQRNTSYSDLRSLRKELKVREKKVLKRVLEQSKVVLSTLTSGSPDGPLKQILNSDGYYPFDVVVIDECSQALEASAWIVLNCAHKCILAGDHKQLPPTIISEKAAKAGLEVSLMERLLKQFKENKIVRMLNVQYRMNKRIMNWSSNVFYSNKLEAFESVSDHTLDDIIEGSNICPLVLIDTAGCDMNELELEDEESKGNEYEADIVCIYVERLIEKGFSQSSIGIISPYNLQVELLRARLKAYEKVEIKSVDGFQGREKEIIILSMVRSNDKHEVGFLSESRRINVAVTRAKRHLVIVCDSDTVTHDPTIKSLIDHFHENGDIISGHEFNDQMQNLAHIQRPSNLRFKAKENSKLKSENQNKQKVKQTVNKHFDKEENREKDIEKKIQEKLEKFMASPDCEVLSFPTVLTSFERLLVHQIAESLNLIHESVGEGNERHIIVKNKSISKSELESIPSEMKQINLVSTQENSENPENPESIQKAENSKNFKKQINDSKSNKNRDHKNVPKIEKSKPKIKLENTKKQILLPDDDDLDALIASVKKADNTCSQTKCKTNISILGSKCQFCGFRFCLSHSMPEIHGCGDKVRAFVKSTARKEGKLYPGSGVPQKKKLDSVKRNYLEKKLSSKLNDMSSDRKTKKPDK